MAAKNSASGLRHRPAIVEPTSGGDSIEIGKQIVDAGGRIGELQFTHFLPTSQGHEIFILEPSVSAKSGMAASCLTKPVRNPAPPPACW